MLLKRSFIRSSKKEFFSALVFGMGSKMLSDIKELPSIQLGNFVLQFELDDLDDVLAEKARKELRETPDRTKESLAVLRDLLKEETDLTIPIDNDNFLIRFLRPCKFYPESACELMKRYFAFKIKHEKIYKNLKPSNEKNIFENNILTVLPNRDQEGRRVLLLELGKKWKPSKVNLDEVFKGCVLFLEAAMIEPKSQVCGCVVVFDMDSLTLQQVWQFTPPFAKRIVDWLQDSIPLRVKAIHIVNQPIIFNMVFALFKPFLREKLKNRIYFHGLDRDSLHQHVDPKCLPDCYGGTLNIPRITGPEWLDLLIKCDKEYEAVNSYGYKSKK